MLEPHGLAGQTQFLKLRRRVETVNGDVLDGRAQILPDGQQVAVHGAQVGHRLPHFVLAFAHAHDDARLGGQGRGQFLDAAQQFQRPAVIPPGAHPPEYPFHRLDVVVEHLRLRRRHCRQGVIVAVKIGYERFHPAAGDGGAHLFDAGGKDAGAAVGQVIAVHRGDDAVLQPHPLDGGGQPEGFAQVQGIGASAGYGAVGAGAGADVAQDHKGGGGAFPALADVGAAGFLADGVQPAVAHQLLQFNIAGAAGHWHFEPVGQAGADGGGGGGHSGLR